MSAWSFRTAVHDTATKRNILTYSHKRMPQPDSGFSVLGNWSAIQQSAKSRQRVGRVWRNTAAKTPSPLHRTSMDHALVACTSGK